MKQAISCLLRHELGSRERGGIFAEVEYAAEDDTRMVTLSHEEIDRLFDACESRGYHEMAVLVRVALLTSADRGVLLSGPRADGDGAGLLVRQVRIFEDGGVYSGEVELADTKTTARPRTVPFSDLLARELLVLARGKRPTDPVFALRYQQFDHAWNSVREAAGLPGLRFKDLRAVCSQYAEKANIPQTVITATMGHDDETMTRRYQQYRAQMTTGQAADLEAALFRRAG
jgi:integrase